MVSNNDLPALAIFFQNDRLEIEPFEAILDTGAATGMTSKAAFRDFKQNLKKSYPKLWTKVREDESTRCFLVPNGDVTTAKIRAHVPTRLMSTKNGIQATFFDVIETGRNPNGQIPFLWSSEQMEYLGGIIDHDNLVLVYRKLRTA